jgi:glycosyltransferase involved in cell wall biosynthesis
VSLPRLTIITPSLNQGQYIERTIRSVLDQGYDDLEYLIFDAGSTDATVSILERYSDRIAYWVSEPDAGQSSAINRGIARATGDVIAYINSDDYYLPGAFAKAMPLFQGADVTWVAGACRYLYDTGELDTVWMPHPPRGPRPRYVHETWYVPQASSFWRREIFERVGPLREDLHYVFDTEFGLRAALAGYTPATIEDELAVRFLHDEAKSADTTPFEQEYVRVSKELLATIPRREHLAYAAARAAYVARMALSPMRLQYRVRRRLGLLDLRARLRRS